MWVFVVFFFKQKTAYEMRISDWSSDVCSSDLHAQICGHWPEDAAAPLDDQCPAGQGVIRDWNHHGYVQTERNVRFLADDIVSAWKQIGDGKDRKSVVSGKSVSVRVDLGGCRIIKKTNKIATNTKIQATS